MPLRFNQKIVLGVLVIVLVAIRPMGSAVQGMFLFFSRNLMLAGPHARSMHNDVLRKENTYLMLENKRLMYLESENKKLRAALDFKENKKFELVETDIIGFNPSSWKKIVIVNIGTSRGVREGMIVVNAQGHLVGKLQEVQRRVSQLVLPDDPDFLLPVYVGQSSYGLLKGSLRGPKVLYIECEQPIQVGDRIWVKTPTLPFPVDIGTVARAIKDKEALFWNIDIALYARNPALDQIFVAK